MNYPVDKNIIEKAAEALLVKDIEKATIREIVAIADIIEQQTGLEFIRMEMGVPGLPASVTGVEAEIEALQSGVASIYPPIDGIPELKKESSRFIKAFMDLDIDSDCCIPIVGSMEGSFISFLIASQCNPLKDTILFIDPGFPVQKQQTTILGCKYLSFDVYDFRGDKLKAELEKHLATGRISCMIYSNPNNPGWFCLQEEELRIIGDLATRYDALVIEDLAYFAMDFRKDLGKPFESPFQASVGRYTDNFILLISGSKAFSYAGQRIAIAAISNSLYRRTFPGLTLRYGGGTFGSIFIHRILYSISTGASHSAQYALAAMFRAASDGKYAFLEDVKEYGRRAQRLKQIFLKHGFEIVYDNDLGEEIADGFYFTIRYPGMTGGELIKALIPFGISAISLSTTGSKQEGLRACTSFIKSHQYELLDERLKAFNEHIFPNRRPVCG